MTRFERVFTEINRDQMRRDAWSGITVLVWFMIVTLLAAGALIAWVAL